jgi:diacylglycerol kinase family enzyme
MSPTTHLLVGNPTAQSGRNAARIARARELLDAAGIATQLLATEPEGRTVAAVRAALDAGEYRCAIAMGGDGTFREVAAGLLESRRRDDVALGMLPTGTANDQGRSFGLEATEEALPRNIGVIAACHETRLDAGKIHAMTAAGETVAEAMFFDSAGFGISARVLAARNADRRFVEQLGPIKELYRDHLVYAGALLRTFLESYVVSDKFDATVIADGELHELTDLTDLILKGTRIYAGAWVFDRASRHDDGLFEIVPFRGKRDWMSKAIVDIDGNPITEEMLNTIGVSHSRPFSAARINLRFHVPEGRAPLCAQIDGEEFPACPRVTIEVVPRALRLIIP